MKGRSALVLLLLLAACGVSDGHRMMMGYQVNELQVTALYDDGTPAQGANIEVQSEGKSIAQGVTDEMGTYTIRPDNGGREITIVSYSAGHRADLTLNLAQKRQEEEVSLPLRVAAGLGYLLGIAGIAMIYLSRKRK
jgi:nickel transport protein